MSSSTRYVPYNDQVEGRWKYHIPVELEGALRERYCSVLDAAFATYAQWLGPMEAYYKARYPRTDETPHGAYNRTIRAKALDALRGLLPAATRSNLGIYGSGQAYEMLLLRMRASNATETRAFAELILQELQKVIPSFIARVDRQDRGVVWSEYFAQTEEAMRMRAAILLGDTTEVTVPEVTLTDFDPDGEIKVVAAALYSVSSLSDSQLLLQARRMSVDERAAVLAAYVGDRKNRRHRPGRAFERTCYRFDVVADYGAFRDLQRHRLLSIEWQTLSPTHGFVVADAIKEAGALDDSYRIMDSSAELYQHLIANSYKEAAPYVISMADRIRFDMEMNAREAIHVHRITNGTSRTRGLPARVSGNAPPHCGTRWI